METVVGATSGGHENESDQALMQRIREGEPDAFSELVIRYQKMVFRFAYSFFRNRDDAMEIVQETFMRIFEKMDRFRDEFSLQSWIYRITHNLCIDYYRKYGRKNMGLHELNPTAEGKSRPPWLKEEIPDLTEIRELVVLSLDRLSPRQKTVFILKNEQGMKLQEISDAMGVSLGTVKTLHHRAMNRIKNHVRRHLNL
jgi:RNA polymerase sigma-70 factor, ECF subfamily